MKLTNQTSLRWGILATGNIARHFCSDLNSSNGNVITAVVSRDIDKANAFAREFHIPNAYSNYQTMLEDTDVDVVYIATPHVFHYENTIAALNAGKHVVCEKPIAMTPKQVKECAALAKEKQLFLLEAVWMAFFPTIQQTKRWLSTNSLGKTLSCDANFEFAAPFDPHSRLYDLQLGGGALMDIGLYPLFFTTYLFGRATINETSCIKASTGADVFSMVRATHSNNVLSQSRFSFLRDAPCEAAIYCEKGVIELHDRFFCGQSVTLTPYDGAPVTKTFEFLGNGYHFEIDAARRAISEGKIECEEYSHQLMIENHEMLAEVRSAIGLSYEN